MRVEIKILLFLLYFGSAFFVIFSLLKSDKGPFLIYSFFIMFLIFILCYGFYFVNQLKTYDNTLKGVFFILSSIGIIILLFPLFHVLNDMKHGFVEKHCIVTTYYDASVIKEKSTKDGMRDVVFTCDKNEIITKSYFLPNNSFTKLLTDYQDFIINIKVGDKDILRIYPHSKVDYNIEYPNGISKNNIGFLDIICFLLLFLKLYLLSRMKNDDIETIKLLRKQNTVHRYF